MTTLQHLDQAPRDPVAPAMAARGEGLTKVFGEGATRVVALDHVDVAFPSEQFTAIMGPSGSGKSTLMHCTAGLDDLTEGRAWVGDAELTGLDDKHLTVLRRDQAGFVLQTFTLLPTLDALENITLPLDIAGRRPDRARLDTVIDALGPGRAGRRSSSPTSRPWTGTCTSTWPRERTPSPCAARWTGCSRRTRW